MQNTEFIVRFFKNGKQEGYDCVNETLPIAKMVINTSLSKGSCDGAKVFERCLTTYKVTEVFSTGATK